MSFKYPQEVDVNIADYVVFTAHKYTVNNPIMGSTNTPAGRDVMSKQTNASGPVQGVPVVLYMPNSTPPVGNGNGWSEQSFAGPLGSIKRDFLSRVTGDILDLGGPVAPGDMAKQIAKQLDDQKNDVGRRVPGAGKQIAIEAIAGFANTTANTLMALSRGKIFNPNIEMIYQGPNIRQFVFDYNFVPKSLEEAQMVNKIIRQFKELSAPKISEGSYFEVPCVWEITYMTRGSKNRNMNAFKRSVLTDVSTQANPDFDYHMSYQDGMPITTGMSLSFSEVDIITRDDHSSSGTDVGY